MRFIPTLFLLLVFSGVMKAENAHRFLSLVTFQPVAAPCENSSEDDFPLPPGDGDWTIPLELEELVEHGHPPIDPNPSAPLVFTIDLMVASGPIRDGVSPLSSYSSPLYLLQRFVI